MITIATLFLVIGAVEKSHVVDWMVRLAFGSRGYVWFGKLRMYVTCFALSIFFNNTPLVAILLPVVKDWGKMRGIPSSQLLIPLSYSVLSGSFISMIGTSTNLTVQGLMQAERRYSFPFFAPAPIGAICFIVLLAYQIVFGPYLLPSTTGVDTIRNTSGELHVVEVYVSEKAYSLGQTLEDTMNSLGIAPSHCIKLRRPVNSEETIVVTRKSFFDYVNYYIRISKFWFHNTVTPSDDEDVIRSFNETKHDYIDMVSPAAEEIIRPRDVLLISSGQDAISKMMKSILGESQGLYILTSNVLLLPTVGNVLVECVISDKNPFLNSPLALIAQQFRETYRAGLVTIRPKTVNEIGAIPINLDEVDIESFEKETDKDSSSKTERNKDNVERFLIYGNPSEHVLEIGDTILCVTELKNVDHLKELPDFFSSTSIGELPKPITFHSAIPVFVFIAMLCLVALECIDMISASLTVTAFFFLGGWITAADIPKLVDINLLMLIATSLSFARAMTKSGLALTIAGEIYKVNPSNYGALMLIYAITLVITELISNNAAAALMYPIATALADTLGVSFKPFAMAVLVASTAGFMSPIGYQTHV